MSDNWIVQNLNSALQTWSDKLAEIWTLLTQSPENFKRDSMSAMIKYRVKILRLGARKHSCE